MWNRKIIVASITSPIYAILLACGVTMTGVRENGGMSDVLSGFLLMTVAYVAVSFPIMLTYGVVTSWCSDWLANRFGSKRSRWFTSFALHILFGLVLSWLSLLATILFFLIDRRLINRMDVMKRAAVKSLLIPIGYLLIVTGSVYIIDVIQDFFVRFNLF
ncbi:MULTISPECIES: hypothetical protein [Exiguobacterium]|uniref:Yip1 domain-containing protein n=1 Tax=Exiguobacterium marinum TaxID=273528 RepID=A0ABY7WY41_9BACL|nr:MULTISPECIES: hypothetical protein [Exiguobacterium]WDH75774.1 hypothetical protein PTI97_13205 [Exiguobacterium marinum]